MGGVRPRLGTDFDPATTCGRRETSPVTFEVFYPPPDRWYEVHRLPVAGRPVRRWYFTRTSAPAGSGPRVALRESERRFRQLADAMPQIVWTAGPDGQIDYLNRRWTSSPGCRRRWATRAGGAPPPRRGPGRGRALGGVGAERRTVRDGDQAPGSARSSPTAGISSEPWPSRTRRGGRPLVRDGTDIHGQKRAEESSRYLAEASAALASVVDYESTLQKVANLAVPYFADWSAVDVANGDGSLRRLAVAHQDAEGRLGHELMRDYPPDPQGRAGPSPSSARASRRSSARSPTTCSCRGRRTNGTCA